MKPRKTLRLGVFDSIEHENTAIYTKLVHNPAIRRIIVIMIITKSR